MMQEKRAYVDFQPFCKWNKGDESDTIELHVQGFKKEQLRVQVNSIGTLQVTGERQLEDRSRSRFRQEFNLTSEYCLNSIRAKLGRGVLHIIVPRKEVNPPTPSSQQSPAPAPAPALAPTQRRKPDRNENPRPSEPNRDEIGSERLWKRGACWRLGFVNRRRVLQVSAAVLAAMAIGVGTYYLASKYLFDRGDHGNGPVPPDFTPPQLVPVPAD